MPYGALSGFVFIIQSELLHHPKRNLQNVAHKGPKPRPMMPSWSWMTLIRINKAIKKPSWVQQTNSHSSGMSCISKLEPNLSLHIGWALYFNWACHEPSLPMVGLLPGAPHLISVAMGKDNGEKIFCKCLGSKASFRQ